MLSKDKALHGLHVLSVTSCQTDLACILCGLKQQLQSQNAEQ